MNFTMIPLTQGQVAIVDEADAAELSRFKWYASKRSNGSFYAVRGKVKAGRKSTILMHRYLLSPPDGFEVDHRNRNSLDNRRSNLRICTHQQNIQNGTVVKGTSKYKGVCWSKQNKKWIARIRHYGEQIFLGLFTDEVEAARAYDAAARHYFGEFANPNFL